MCPEAINVRGHWPIIWAIIGAIIILGRKLHSGQLLFGAIIVQDFVLVITIGPIICRMRQIIVRIAIILTNHSRVFNILRI